MLVDKVYNIEFYWLLFCVVDKLSDISILLNIHTFHLFQKEVSSPSTCIFQFPFLFFASQMIFRVKYFAKFQSFNSTIVRGIRALKNCQNSKGRQQITSPYRTWLLQFSASNYIFIEAQALSSYVTFVGAKNTVKYCKIFSAISQSSEQNRNLCFPSHLSFAN